MKHLSGIGEAAITCSYFTEIRAVYRGIVLHVLVNSISRGIYLYPASFCEDWPGLKFGCTSVGKNS